MLLYFAKIFKIFNIRFSEFIVLIIGFIYNHVLEIARNTQKIVKTKILFLRPSARKILIPGVL